MSREFDFVVRVRVGEPDYQMTKDQSRKHAREFLTWFVGESSINGSHGLVRATRISRGRFAPARAPEASK